MEQVEHMKRVLTIIKSNKQVVFYRRLTPNIRNAGLTTNTYRHPEGQRHNACAFKAASPPKNGLVKIIGWNLLYQEIALFHP